MKTVEIYLPFYSKGDDLKTRIEHSASIDEAFEKYAQDLDEAAHSLREVKALVAGHEIEVFADEDVIEITAPDEVIDALEKAGLLMEYFDVEGELTTALG